jgi:hypothetical protein
MSRTWLNAHSRRIGRQLQRHVRSLCTCSARKSAQWFGLRTRSCRTCDGRGCYQFETFVVVVATDLADCHRYLLSVAPRKIEQTAFGRTRCLLVQGRCPCAPSAFCPTLQGADRRLVFWPSSRRTEPLRTVRPLYRCMRTPSLLSDRKKAPATLTCNFAIRKLQL